MKSFKFMVDWNFTSYKCRNQNLLKTILTKQSFHVTVLIQFMEKRLLGGIASDWTMKIKVSNLSESRSSISCPLNEVNSAT